MVARLLDLNISRGEGWQVACFNPAVQHSLGCDPAELPMASYWPDMAAEIDDPTGRDACATTAPADLFRYVWALVAEHPRVDVAFWAVAVARHMEIVQGRSCDSLAVMLGVTPSDFSKVVNYYCDLFATPRPPHCKSQRAREVYSRIQKADHWRDRNGLDFVTRGRKDEGRSVAEA